jgi:hypothetical protein
MMTRGGVFHHYCKQVKQDADEDKCDDCQKVLVKLIKREEDIGNPVKLCTICGRRIFSNETVVFNQDMTIASHRGCYRFVHGQTELN